MPPLSRSIAICVAVCSAVVVATRGSAQSGQGVDHGPRVVPNGVAPLFPDSLRALGLEASVTVQYTVDSTGRPDTASLFAGPEVHPLVLASIRDALVRMQFEPAVRNGRRTAEDVQQRFEFRIAPATPISSGEMPANVAAWLERHAASYAPSVIGPEYPPALARAGIEGEVDAEFVIDSAGYVDLATFRVLAVKATRPVQFAPQRSATSNPRESGTTDVAFPEDAFVRAVRHALPRLRFIPAHSNGHDVAQRVQQPFMFNLAK